MRAYKVTMIGAAHRVVRTVIAPGGVQAARIALRLIPDGAVPVAIICAPLVGRAPCSH